ncbi:MAG: amidohydrolase family protein [Chitinophagaceae bacterium]|nr:amidohydrolase family protein [Chitinophagaceae bacterium]
MIRKATIVFILFLVFHSENKAQKVITEVNASEIVVGKAVIAVTGVRIIDGNGGAPIENGSVVVANGKIVDVGQADRVKIPAGAEKVDGKGMSLLPGFIDAHFHIDGVDELPGMFLQNGVTSIRDPGAWMETYENARKSGKPQPRMFLSGPHIDMFPPAYPNDAYVVRDAAEAVTQVNRAADQGSTMIKAYFRLPPSIIKEVCIAAHKRGIPVSAHLETTEAMEAIEAGLDGIEHVTSFGLTMAPKREGEKFRQNVLADNNARRNGRYEIWSQLDLKGKMADSLVKFLVKKKTFVDPTLGAFEYREENGKLDTVKLQGFNNMKAFTGIMKKGGVHVVLGSHSMIKYAEKGWAYQREMELFAESGLTNAQIIVASTMENARFFRISDKLGSIEKGKIADLVLVKGNPLDNISDARNVEKVMLNGVWVK